MSSATASRDAVPEAVTPRLLSECLAYPDRTWADALRPRLERGPFRRARDLAAALAADGVDALRAEHFRLFGPAAACRPDLAPYLTDNDFEQARKLADLAGFYRAFGLEAPARRPDDVAVALEFLAYLRFKRRYALAEGWTERAEVTARAEREFLSAYLRPGLVRFADTLGKRAEPGFYRVLAAACRGWARRRWWTWWR